MSIVTNSNSIQLRYIPVDEVVWAWKEAEPYIMSAADRSKELTAAQIVGMILQTKLHLFLIYSDHNLIGAGTVQILEFPDRKVAHIWHLGGDDFLLIVDLLDEFSAWAKALGATALRLTGRRGWKRKLASIGFQETAVTLERQL